MTAQIKPGAIEVHPTELAIVVHYEVGCTLRAGGRLPVLAAYRKA